jgi:uncharacterized protein YyaL (SSP411 family)
MERESFENPEVANLLNDSFVSIKVDREERPDVDSIYMTFVQATSGQGGWPMSVFLTPQLQPFYGGTYYPPESRHGRPGFKQLLQRLAILWVSRREELLKSATEIHERLLQATQESQVGGTVVLSPELLRQAGSVLKQTYDPIHAGFGQAPKFPQPAHPAFLLRYALRFKDQEALRMVLHTCDKMAAGGIHDQLGGGFARYSVDAEWLVPHFEKMLYDNAQLASLYLEAYVASRNARHADTARSTLDYVLRDMTHPEGGFYSAEDADSEGHEGKYYCWTRKELIELLNEAEAEVAFRYFGISEEGNFVDHSHPRPLPNQNVLSIASPQLSAEERELLASAKRKMLAARSKRVRPHLDDKILASWNGLMLAAMAKGFAVLGEMKYLTAAERNLQFVTEHLWDAKSRTLYHRWRDGERDQVQLLKAYSFLLLGVIELYEATLNPDQLTFAIALAETMLERFYDREPGGFWQTPQGLPDLLVRSKEDYDGAEPSGNSAAVLALLKLGHIAENPSFIKSAQNTLRFFSARLTETPHALPLMLQAFDFNLDEPRRLVVAGDPNDARARSLLRTIHSAFQPNKIVLGTLGPAAPFVKTLPVREEPIVYPCTGNACQAPTGDPTELLKFLNG